MLYQNETHIIIENQRYKVVTYDNRQNCKIRKYWRIGYGIPPTLEGYGPNYGIKQVNGLYTYDIYADELALVLDPETSNQWGEISL